VKAFIQDLKQHWQHRPFVWSEPEGPSKLRPPARGRVLVLGPHPDDPECVAITCRLLRKCGCELWYAIVSLSPSGVEDAYGPCAAHRGFPSLKNLKADIRREEQIRSTEMFGLPRDHLAFLGLEEERDLDCASNREKIQDHLKLLGPEMVILPAGRDTNRTHAWVNRVFRECAGDLALLIGRPVVALYNEDPKTLAMREDLYVLFGPEGARWKGSLLKAHDSQAHRNQLAYGMGFHERILRMNQATHRRLSAGRPSPFAAGYAECFELELFDLHPPTGQIPHQA